MALSSCGKSYPTEDEAARSKRVVNGTGVPVQCWISGHGWHVRTPTDAGGPAGQPARKSGLRPRSQKMQAIYQDRAKLVAGLLENRPWCEIRWDTTGCTGRSTEVHEPEMRSRGADILDEDACVTACHYCHMAAHAHPAEATARGFMVPSKPVDKPWEATA